MPASENHHFYYASRTTHSLQLTSTQSVLISKLQIWDTAGQERFRTITATYYRGTHGVIVVYDVTDRESYENVQRWMTEIDKNCENVSRVLVGNKIDMVNDIAIHADEANEYAQKMNVPHFMTSAKSAEKVDK